MHGQMFLGARSRMMMVEGVVEEDGSMGVDGVGRWRDDGAGNKWEEWMEVDEQMIAPEGDSRRGVSSFEMLLVAASKIRFCLRCSIATDSVAQ